MRVSSHWIELDEVESTQSELAARVREGETDLIVWSAHQTGGRGRFGRPWVSTRGESLTMSIAFGHYIGHPRPWLLGMACACALAELFDAQIQWPNDVSLNGRKLGGILTDLSHDAKGSAVPCVGIGVNLNQQSFPDELAGRATSLVAEGRKVLDARACARDLVEQISGLPDPLEWSDLAPYWLPRDATPGKPYRLPNGDVGRAISVAPGGELDCEVNGERRLILAADSIFGHSQAS